MKVQLSIGARDLPAADYYASVTLNATDDDEGSDTLLGKTEVAADTTSPAWTKMFTFNVEEGSSRRIAIDIYDGSETWWGNRSFEIDEIMGQPGHVQAKKMSKGGIIIAHAVECEGSGNLKLKIRGHKLRNVEGLGIFKKSDPFLTIYRKEGDQWVEVHRTEYVKDELSPVWKSFELEISELCDGDLDAPIRGEVYDYDKDGSHDHIGHFETSVNGLLAQKPDDDDAITLRSQGQRMGKIVVLSCSLEDYTDPREAARKAIEVAGKAESLRLSAEEKAAEADAAANEAKEAQDKAEEAKMAADDLAEKAEVAAQEAEAAKAAAEEAEAELAAL